MKKPLLTIISAAIVAVTLLTTLASAADYKQRVEDYWLKMLDPNSSVFSTKAEKAATSGSGPMDPTQDAYGAVNGERHEGTGFHTSEDTVAWLAIDLGKEYAIGRVDVYNREDCPQRAYDLEILFSNDGKKWEDVYQNKGKEFHGGNNGQEPLRVPFDGKKARWVRIQIKNGFLHLSEIEVYAKGDDKTNVALKKYATQSSTSEWSTRSLAQPAKPSVGETAEDAPKIPTKPTGPLGIPNARGELRNYANKVTPGVIEKLLEITEKTLDYVAAKTKIDAEKKRFEQFQGYWHHTLSQENDANKRLNFYLALRHLRRDTLFKHPDLNIEKVLINRVPPPGYSHNGDQNLGRHARKGPGLTILTDWKADVKATPLLQEGLLPEGSVRHPCLDYDANKVVFGFCDHTKPGQKRFFLYEATLDGKSVRQITGTKDDPFETHGNRATAILEDNDPCYLPDGDIMFISTRCQSYGRCHGGRYNPAWTLYRTTPDGKNIRQVSYNNENEYEPAVLNDGRIVFTRWEYTNRHEMWFHMLWACRPDGTEVTNYYGADTIFPMMVVECNAIPGTHKTVATSMAHHSYNTGTIVIIDPKKGENGEAPLTRLTPETGDPECPGVGWPTPHWSHPYAVNEDLFFVSRANHHVHKQGQTPPVNDRAIYLVDTFGGREFIYEDPEVASFSPMAVRKRQRPPVLPSRVTPEQDYATLFVQNAYLTRNDPEGLIKPGMIKELRVNALGVQPISGKVSISSRVGVEIPKKVIGTVPVGPDGSAFFKVPANTSLQMQILDKDGMAILTEKSFFYLQPGENRSCVGCHEPSGMAPDASVFAKMSRMRPMDLRPAAGPKYPGGNSFHRSVQPVLDRYCIRCHGLEKTEKGVNFVGDRALITVGMRALVDRGDHRVGDKGYMQSMHGSGNDGNISTPRRFYAYSNKVAQMLAGNKELAGEKYVDAHKDLKIDPESKRQIIEWMDLNCQSAGDMFRNRPIDSRRVQRIKMIKLREYAKSLFGDKFAGSKVPDRALINILQPDQSRVLLAPLPTNKGGWGQLNGYRDTNDEKFKKMQELVEAAISRSASENTRGWWPLHGYGGDDRWVADERRKLFEALGRNYDKEMAKREGREYVEPEKK